MKKLMGVFLIFIGLFALSAWIFMLLFNVISAWLGGPIMNYWVALAVVWLLNFLRNILFKEDKK